MEVVDEFVRGWRSFDACSSGSGQLRSLNPSGSSSFLGMASRSLSTFACGGA